MPFLSSGQGWGLRALTVGSFHGKEDSNNASHGREAPGREREKASLGAQKYLLALRARTSYQLARTSLNTWLSLRRIQCPHPQGRTWVRPIRPCQHWPRRSRAKEQPCTTQGHVRTETESQFWKNQTKWEQENPKQQRLMTSVETGTWTDYNMMLWDYRYFLRPGFIEASFILRRYILQDLEVKTHSICHLLTDGKAKK